MAFLGQESFWAAEASECAADQGAFWQYHDKIFDSHAGENQGAYSKDRLKGFAAELGLDAAAFNTCLDSGKYTQEVLAQTAVAQQLGVRGTPTFYVNEWMAQAGTLADLEPTIAKAKQGLRPAPTPTPLPAGAQFFDADPARPGFTYDGSPSLGADDAPVVVLMFEDFKNPESAAHVADAEPTLKAKYVDTGEARFVVKFFPVSAPKAAVAALCAAKQGEFWEYRSLLYSKQAEWQEGDDAALLAYADSLGLDTAQFTQCADDAQVRAEIDTALEFGQQEIGVPTVPSYLVLKLGASGQVEAGQGYPGALSLAEFEQAIEAIRMPPAPEPAGISPDKLASLPVGIDGEGNFYRGDPAAPIRLVDFSDFQ